MSRAPRKRGKIGLASRPKIGKEVFHRATDSGFGRDALKRGHRSAMTKRILPLVAMVAALSLSGCLSVPPAYRVSGAGCTPKMEAPVPAREAIYFVALGDPDCAGDKLVALSARRGSFHNLHEQAIEPVRYGFATQGTEKAPVLAFAAKDAWDDGLRQSLQAPPRRILLYVHGYNNGATAALSAADQIAAAARFDGPVVAFIWPSQHAVTKYTWDEENAHWAQAYFDDVLVDLVRQMPEREVVLVSHSMGTRLAIDGLRHLQTTNPDLAGRIRTVVLASPDIDREVFDHDLARDVVRKGRRIALFASGHDLVLRSSWGVHGNPRIGDLGCVFRLRRLNTMPSDRCYPGAPTLPGMPARPADFTVIDGTDITAGLGHRNHIETPEGRMALRQFLAEPPRLPPATDGRIVLAPMISPDCTSGRTRLALKFSIARCGRKTRGGLEAPAGARD